MERCWRLYLGRRRRRRPRRLAAARRRPGRRRRRRYIAVAGHDVLRDDGLRYAEALRAAGVDVTLERYDDMVHGFLRWGGVVERARELHRRGRGICARRSIR